MVERYRAKQDVAWMHGIVTLVESGMGLRIHVRVDGEKRDRVFGGAIGPRVIIVEGASEPRD